MPVRSTFLSADVVVPIENKNCGSVDSLSPRISSIVLICWNVIFEFPDRLWHTLYCDTKARYLIEHAALSRWYPIACISAAMVLQTILFLETCFSKWKCDLTHTRSAFFSVSVHSTAPGFRPPFFFLSDALSVCTTRELPWEFLLSVTGLSSFAATLRAFG